MSIFTVLLLNVEHARPFEVAHRPAKLTGYRVEMPRNLQPSYTTAVGYNVFPGVRVNFVQFKERPLPLDMLHLARSLIYHVALKRLHAATQDFEPFVCVAAYVYRNGADIGVDG